MKLLMACLLVALVGCGPTPQSPRREGPAEMEEGRPSRPLVIAVKAEPVSITTRVLGQPGTGLRTFRTLFNAFIAQRDDTSTWRPYLVDPLPALHTDSWRVFPDGRMETTYRLGPNLAWHDGTALSAEDFVFAWRIFLTPEYGFANAPPFGAIDQVQAVNDRTFVIRWNRPYPAAADLSVLNDELAPLPRHVLRQPYEELPADAFARISFWTRDYVGLGPYRLDRWEPGAFLEATAFDRYVHGRPKIERLRLVFISDPNTALANVLAREVHVADTAVGIEQVQVLEREWGGAGTVLIDAGASFRLTFFQLRPELTNPPAILDPRVRKALAHALDKQAMNEVAQRGYGRLASSMIAPLSEFGRAADRGAVSYPYDLRRSEQLMEEAGFRKGPDGYYASVTRLTASLQTSYTPYSERELLIQAAGWRSAGFEVQESVIPAAQAQDAQLGATFPTMLTRTTFGGLTTMVDFTSAGIPRAENRWRGVNRGGWVNPEYDRLVDAFSGTLDAAQRAEQVTQMIRVYTDELPAIPLYFFGSVFAYVSALRGPQKVPVETDQLWNVHRWEFQ